MAGQSVQQADIPTIPVPHDLLNDFKNVCHNFTTLDFSFIILWKIVAFYNYCRIIYCDNNLVKV